jgi:pyruvate formate lyase activating enzyme
MTTTSGWSASKWSATIKEKTMEPIICPVCFHHCKLAEGQTGFCRARRNDGGTIRPVNYGLLTSLALDPIEKKPLRRFYPGSLILSAGSFGCNLRCPFCQNFEISQDSPLQDPALPAEYYSPEQLTGIARRLKQQGNIGAAFTYNEPLVGWEYVRDSARLIKEAGMKTVLVTNGSVCLPILQEVEPYIDAMNIDLKGFTAEFYRDLLQGDLDTVKAFIREAAQHCHVELTTLIIPGKNDSDEEMRRLSGWVASLDPAIPLHISRFFPRYQMRDSRPTPVDTVYHLTEVAAENLRYVYPGNC